MKNNNFYINKLREKLIKKSKRVEIESFLFNKFYIGSGIKYIFKRMLKYKFKYIKYIFYRINKFHFLKTKTFFNKEILLYLKDANSWLYYYGALSEIEWGLINFLIKNLQPQDIFYDIGANYGFYSLLAGEFIDEGEIHAFEPSPEIYLALKENLKNYNNVFINNCALSDKEGMIKFYSGHRYNNSSILTIVEDYAKLKNKEGELYEEIFIKSFTLDKYIENHKKPTIIKIDVDGSENLVIRGGMKFFSTGSPIIAVEMGSDEARLCRSCETIDILLKLGYKIFDISKTGNLIEITCNDINDILYLLSKIPKDKSHNFIFKK
jgi:FkbM family methyltransferase